MQNNLFKKNIRPNQVCDLKCKFEELSHNVQAIFNTFFIPQSKKNTI